MIKTAFISIHIKKSPLSFPLSSAVLASAVDNNPELQGKVETSIMDFFITDNIISTAIEIIDSGIDIAAFSVYLWNRDFFISLIRELKNQKAEITVIAGGAEVTSDPLFFAEHQDIDWIVNGEGEDAVSEYFSCFSDNTENNLNSNNDDINSQHMKSVSEDLNNHIIRNTVTDPGNYPSPIIEKKINLNNYDGILWELSRGCPFKCGFCFESRGRNKVRKFPIERIKEELAIIKCSGINQVFVLDPTFNTDLKRAKQILTLIKNTAKDIHFTFEARSEFIDRETARLFSEITCSIQIGLQSSSHDVLENVNRRLDEEDFYEKILLLHEEGAVYGFDIIYGLPGDTFDKYLKSIDFAISMQPNHLDIFPLAILKGTDLYERTEEFQIEYKKSDPYTVIRTPDFSAEELDKAYKTASALDLFYNKGKAVTFLPFILENMNMLPSEFFQQFSSWISNNSIKIDNLPETRITSIQIDFISYVFNNRNQIKESILVSDIILYLKSDNSHDSQLSGLFDIQKVFDYLETGVTDLEELVFFTKFSN